MSRIRSLIVGTGVVSIYHVEAVAGHADRIEIVGAVDADPGRLAAFCDQHGVRGYASFEDALRDVRPHLVQIGSPPALHREQIVASLRAGAHVFCEKPLCSSLAEADEIEAAERETGRWCVGVFQLRFGSAVRHLAGLIEQRALGRFLIGSSQANFYRDDAYYAAPWRGTWEHELGGATTGLGIHMIDLCLRLLGSWHDVSAAIGTLSHDIEVDDAAVGHLRLDGGGLLSLVSSTVSPRQENALRLDFEDGTVELRSGHWYWNGDWTYTPREGVDPAPWPPTHDTTGDHTAQLATLLDALERGERPPATTREIRPTLELLAAFYKAAATGSRIERGSIGADDPFYQHQAGTWRTSAPVPA